jgi:Leucine-rich repeat (LRR) protein
MWPTFLPLLEKLYLSDNSLTEIDSAIMCNLPLLIDLDISFNNLRNIESVYGLRYLNKLEKIIIHDNPIYGLNENEVSDLKSWLIKECFSLKIISGNVIDRTEDILIIEKSIQERPLDCTLHYIDLLSDLKIPAPSTIIASKAEMKAEGVIKNRHVCTFIDLDKCV